MSLVMALAGLSAAAFAVLGLSYRAERGGAPRAARPEDHGEAVVALAFMEARRAFLKTLGKSQVGRWRH